MTKTLYAIRLQSLFGKNLKTILNEYVAAKTKGMY